MEARGDMLAVLQNGYDKARTEVSNRSLDELRESPEPMSTNACDRLLARLTQSMIQLKRSWNRLSSRKHA